MLSLCQTSTRPSDNKDLPTHDVRTTTIIHQCSGSSRTRSIYYCISCIRLATSPPYPSVFTRVGQCSGSSRTRWIYLVFLVFASQRLLPRYVVSLFGRWLSLIYILTRVVFFFQLLWIIQNTLCSGLPLHFRCLLDRQAAFRAAEENSEAVLRAQVYFFIVISFITN